MATDQEISNLRSFIMANDGATEVQLERLVEEAEYDPQALDALRSDPGPGITYHDHRFYAERPQQPEY